MTNTKKKTSRPTRKQKFVNGRKSAIKAKSRPDTKRIGWSRGLSERELARPGGILLLMLIHCANENGHHLCEMASKLGVTYGYIHQLRTGTRSIAHISPKFSTACARYLGCPRMTVLFAAGQVRPEDAFEDPLEMVSALPVALRFIQSNPTYGPRITPEVFNLSPQVQLLIVTLFEAAEGRTLLPGRQDTVKVANDIQTYELKQARLKEQVEADRAVKKGARKKKRQV